VGPLGHQDHGWQQLLSTFRQHAAALAASRKLVLDVELPTVWVTPDTWMEDDRGLTWLTWFDDV